MNYERDADYLAMYILSRAGITLNGVENVWLRLDVETDFSGGYGWSHPAYEERFARIIATRDEINEKITLGEPILPNRK